MRKNSVWSGCVIYVYTGKSRSISNFTQPFTVLIFLAKIVGIVVRIIGHPQPRPPPQMWQLRRRLLLPLLRLSSMQLSAHQKLPQTVELHQEVNTLLFWILRTTYFTLPIIDPKLLSRYKYSKYMNMLCRTRMLEDSLGAIFFCKCARRSERAIILCQKSILLLENAIMGARRKRQGFI